MNVLQVFLPEIDTDPRRSSLLFQVLLEQELRLSHRTPHMKPKHSRLALAEALGNAILYFLRESEA